MLEIYNDCSMLSKVYIIKMSIFISTSSENHVDSKAISVIYLQLCPIYQTLIMLNQNVIKNN